MDTRPDVRLRPLVRPGDDDAVVELLTTQDWPFHSGGPASAQGVRARLAAGRFDGAGTRCWWVVAQGARQGLLRVDDLGDPTVEIDVRLRAASRGRGLGAAALRLLLDVVFAEHPDVARVEATTREDNTAMRRALRRAGFVKEAHHRDGWPGVDGTVHDAVGYAVLRHDHAGGVTTPVRWDDEPA